MWCGGGTTLWDGNGGEIPVHVQVGTKWGKDLECPGEASLEVTKLRVSRRRKGPFAKACIFRAVGEKRGMCVGLRVHSEG